MRKLVAYGRDLVASLQRQNMPRPDVEIARRFGTFDLAVIIARITRGLAIAADLEARLVRTPPTRDMPPRTNPALPTASPRPRPTRPPAKRPPTPSQSEDDAALLRSLPSAEEIAALIRRRPAGAVIVEIYRDLGIDTAHPLWPEVRDAIIRYDGSLVRMLNVWFGRLAVFLTALTDNAKAPPSPAWNGPLSASTGPP